MLGTIGYDLLFYWQGNPCFSYSMCFIIYILYATILFNIVLVYHIVICYPLFGFDLMSLHPKVSLSLYYAIVTFLLSTSLGFMDFHAFARGIVSFY